MLESLPSRTKVCFLPHDRYVARNRDKSRAEKNCRGETTCLSILHDTTLMDGIATERRLLSLVTAWPQLVKYPLSDKQLY